jgi:SAM-dependent methyltransferase
MADRPYHPYVFDAKRRVFVGRFEAMYRAESRDGFDSWFQSDLTHLGKQLSLAILDRHQFHSILDVGCGKGTFTHLLKRVENQVVGVDMSAAAIRKARAAYREVEFRRQTVQQALAPKKTWDLIVMAEILSYVRDWPTVLRSAATRGTSVFVSLYLPENPMGYIKTFSEFREVFSRWFSVETDVVVDGSQLLILGKARRRKSNAAV